MSIPTVAVTCIAYDQNGNPVIGGLFRARLDRTETYNGFVVPEQVTGTADANGVVVLQLWPNALGVAGSSYRITAINPDTRQQYLNTTAVVPNSACNLHEIIVAAPFPPIDASEQALIAAQGSLALVTAQAGIASAAATEAEGHADDAQDSATAAQGFAADASASFTDFDKRYLGTKASDPIVDNEGNALQIGALYYRLEAGLRIYDGAIWSAAYISEAGSLTTSDIGATVQAYSENLDDFAAKTAPDGEIVGTTDIQTLSAKSISGSTNTITNIANTSLVNSAVTVNGQTVALGASTTVTATATNPLTLGTGLNGSSYNGSAPVTVSLANTTVTPASYGSASNTLTATVNAQGQLTALAATPIAIANTQVSGLGTASILNAAVASGVATLDAGGKVPLSQIPQSIQGAMIYQGSWNASINTPTIVSGTGSKGNYYVVSVGGTTTIDGISDWLPGDWIIFNGTVWEKIDNTDSVSSVNGYIGTVSINAADVGAPPTTRTITAGTGLTGGGNLSADRTIEIDSTVVTLTGTQTLTNKTLTSPTGIVKGDVGLGNVDNTSDATKNSATATLTNKTINLTDNTLQATSAQIAAAVTDETGTGSLVFANSPTLVTPALGTPSSVTLTNATGLPVSTGISGLGTGIAAALAVNVGTAGAPVINGGVLGTPSSGTVTNLTGTASININGTVGATTASTGAFTTLTTSSTVTHNGGTANGVAYLNGSKVLTTGSALTFDGTNLGLQSATNAYAGSRNGATFRANSGNGFEFILQSTNATAGTSTGFATAVTGNDIYFVNRLDGFYSWITGASGNSEQMRLTSTGLGIGTSSPVSRLQVVDGDITVTTSGSFSGFNSTRATTPSAIGQQIGRLSFSAYSTGTTYVQGASVQAFSDAAWSSTSAPSYLSFQTTASGNTSLTERMRLDSSGNLGLGVTPSAWGSSRKTIQVGTAAGEGVFASSSTYGFFGTNCYLDSAGNNRRVNTGFAQEYRQWNDGSHQWMITGTSTANSTISFTQAMTLTAGGNQLLGTTTDSGERSVIVGTANSDQIRFSDAANATGFLGNRTGGLTTMHTNGALAFGTGNATFSERARIDTSGNLIQTVNTTAATLATNGTLTFSIVDNSTLRISVRGSDGTTRTATVALT